MLIIRVLQCEWGAQNDHEVSMAKVPALEVHAANGKHHDFQGRRPQVTQVGWRLSVREKKMRQ